MSDENISTNADVSLGENFTDSITASKENLNNDLDMVRDIHVTLSIELGSKTIKLKELLELSKNSVIELNKTAGKPLDIKANNTLVARGEVVSVNGRYGIRLTELVNALERTRGL